MADDQDELELWQRARQNDGDAFAQLFDLHRQRVFRRAWGLTETTTDADDLSAAAFFELWRKRRSVTPVGGSVLPWLLVTVLNLSRNLQRSTSRPSAIGTNAMARGERLIAHHPYVDAMSVPEVAAVETARATRVENVFGAIAIPIAILGILLSFLAMAGIYVSLIPSLASLVLGLVRVSIARRRETSATWAFVAITIAGASCLLGAAFWALPHLFLLLADRGA